MTRRLILTPKARADLITIAAYIARDSPGAADRLVDRLAQRSEWLLEHPGIGHGDDGRPARRLYAVGNYLIIYRELPDAILVLRYVHARRDLRRV